MNRIRAMEDFIDIPSKNPPDCHVFLVTGNPGLISYYLEFLHLLHLEVNERICTQLSRASTRKYNGISIYGRSLKRFELNQSTSGKAGEHVEAPKTPLSLNQQIDFVEKELEQYAKARNQFKDDISKKIKIILVGHSVGAYIILEILRRRNERLKTSRREEPLDANADLVSGILLFPTVVDIAKSAAGRKAVWGISVPYFPFLIGYIAKFLTALIPLATLIWIVQRVTGMPPNAAGVTAQFLKSEMGVTQALYMARDEMNEIKADRWNEEIWGTSGNTVEDLRITTVAQTKLFFFFGRNDHWVAEQTRDEIIATRANSLDVRVVGQLQPRPKDSRPMMQVDETGLPHGFCLRYSRPVALVVARYIEQILIETGGG